MKWHGPVRYQAHPTHSAEALSIDWGKHSALKSKQGVYVKTIQTERGRGIVYVGTAHGRNGFQGRLELDQENHKSCYLDGRYMLEDPEQMKQGIRQRVNYGLLNLELSMRGPQGIQREKLPEDLLEKVEETHQFGIENRRTVLARIEATAAFQHIAESQPECLQEWRGKLLQGMSVRTAPKPFSQPWRKLNRLLKEHYLQSYFTEIQGRSIGAQLLQLFEIYLYPLEDKRQSLELEGTIFQSVCHHPVPWVRQFIQFGIAQPLHQGRSISLEALSAQCGITYAGNQEDAVFALE